MLTLHQWLIDAQPYRPMAPYRSDGSHWPAQLPTAEDWRALVDEAVCRAECADDAFRYVAGECRDNGWALNTEGLPDAVCHWPSGLAREPGQVSRAWEPKRPVPASGTSAEDDCG